MRLMCAAALSLTIGLFLAFADEKKPSDTKTTRADQLKTLQKKFDKERNDLKKQFDLSRDIADKNGINQEIRELAILTARDALKLAEEDPKDATGFDAAMFVLEKTGEFGPGDEFDAAITLIGEHHLNNPKVKDLLLRIPSVVGPRGQKLLQSSVGQKFLQTASEKASDKEVKGLALFLLGIAASEQMEEEEDDKKIEELIARAAQNFKKAVKEAPDARIGTTTIGKAAATQLETLQAFKILAVGKPLPEIEGTDLGGKKIKLSSYKGKVVLLDIWATWCGPCRAMIPHEQDMVKKLKNKPFTLLSVSCDEEQETLVKFFEKEQMPWDHWFDGRGGSVAKTFRIRAFPTLYLIDHSGILRNKWIGNPGDDKLEKAIEDLVNDAVKAKG